MPSKIQKNGHPKWKGRVQKNGIIRQKLFDTKAEALAWEAEERKKDWNKEIDTACSLRQWAEKYLDHAEKYSRKTYNEKRQALRELFAAKQGTGKRQVAIVDPDAPVASLTPGKVLAALRIQYELRSGNAANKDRKNLVAAWNWGMKYLGMPGPNPCLVEKFPEERSPRYIPPEADFWKVFQQTQGQDASWCWPICIWMRGAVNYSACAGKMWTSVIAGSALVPASGRAAVWNMTGCP